MNDRNDDWLDALNDLPRVEDRRACALEGWVDAVVLVALAAAGLLALFL